MNKKQELEEYFKVLEIPEVVLKYIWEKIKDDNFCINIFYTVFGLVAHHKKHNVKKITWIAPIPSHTYYNKESFIYYCNILSIKKDISDMIWDIIKQDDLMCRIFMPVFGIACCEISPKFIN